MSILSYNLEVDDGTGSGNFSELYGETSDSNLLTHTYTSVTQGTTYGFRYRAKNQFGWGDYSDVTYIVAATVPSAPPKPEFVSATDSSISLSFSLSSDNGGSTITGYKLQKSTDGSSFSDTNYVESSFSLTHTLTTAADSLVAGTVYYFRWHAINAIGTSDASETLAVAASDPPAQPSAPTINYTYSTKTMAYIQWSEVADGTSPGGLISGYELYIDDGQGGDYNLIYDTTQLSPDITSLAVSDLTTNIGYRMYLIAHNYNEASDPSSVTTFYPCEVPSGFD